jgi:hypothetical protein
MKLSNDDIIHYFDSAVEAVAQAITWSAYMKAFDDIAEKIGISSEVLFDFVSESGPPTSIEDFFAYLKGKESCTPPSIT